MRAILRLIALGLCILALPALAAASAGCGGSGGSDGATRWKEVVTADISGAEPVKKLLGTYTLGDRVRLGWELSGAENPSVMFTLRVVEVTAGTGYGASLSPSDAAFTMSGDEVIVLGPFGPSDYRVYFSQRFPPSEGPGYDVKLTISTTE